jgi:CMP-N-acetylneuraminic acid synthetase
LYKKKKVLAVVLARSGSKGIKNKNLKKINNVSLVGLVGKFLNKFKFIDLAIVSTNSEKIAKEAGKYNLSSFFKRPKSLSGPKVSDEKALYHALTTIEKKFKVRFDIILSLPPTSPLRKPSDLTKSINKLVKNNYDAVWSISETDKKFHPYKSLILKMNKLKFFSNIGRKVKYRQQLFQTYYRNGACYAFSRKAILNKDILPKNSSYIISDSEQVSIDGLDDLIIVKKFINSK